MTVYDDEFYDTITDGSVKSAEVVVPLVMEEYGPKTVVDVGCGRGVWGREFQEHGCHVLGVDGEYVVAPVIAFMAHDLTTPLPDDFGPFDLAVCLEVAEHLPESSADAFVAQLCNLSDTVLFSAAVPTQTGTDHVNCQYPSYWAEKFSDNGLGVVDKLRWKIWDDESVEPWYRQNIMVYQRGIEPSVPADVVHPVIHLWGRQ